MQNFLMHILSGRSVQLNVIFIYNQNINFVEQGAWKKVALLFNGATRRSIVCMLFLCRYFNVMHWIAIGLLIKSATFFLALYFINSVISQYSGECGQWITTQNGRKKILHALHFKWTILITYLLKLYQKVSDGNLIFLVSRVYVMCIICACICMAQWWKLIDSEFDYQMKYFKLFEQYKFSLK